MFGRGIKADTETAQIVDTHDLRTFLTESLDIRVRESALDIRVCESELDM